MCDSISVVVLDEDATSLGEACLKYTVLGHRCSLLTEVDLMSFVPKHSNGDEISLELRYVVYILQLEFGAVSSKRYLTS